MLRQRREVLYGEITGIRAEDSDKSDFPEQRKSANGTASEELKQQGRARCRQERRMHQHAIRSAMRDAYDSKHSATLIRRSMPGGRTPVRTKLSGTMVRPSRQTRRSEGIGMLRDWTDRTRQG